MMSRARIAPRVLALVLIVAFMPAAGPAGAASPAAIDRDVDFAMRSMLDSVPNARHLNGQAKGVLVFPSIVKAGFLFGAQYGEGALRQKGRTTGYYNTVAASYGLQAGIQSFGYALFFMTDSALQYLDRTGGFELGTGPSVVILDTGAARALTTTTMQNDIYAVFFDQRGLMAGAGLQGSKITRIGD
jgi:lipid-binding SYLF domain-containing protein